MLLWTQRKTCQLCAGWPGVAWCVAMLHMTLSMLQSLPWKISLPLRSKGLVKLEQLYLGTFIQNAVLPHLAGGGS